MNKKFGFTLAEVLIALTIIGVVSVMTVPTLMNKTTKKTQAELIHKAYVDLEDAIELAMNDNDYKTTVPLFNSLDKVEAFLTTYFRINKNCKFYEYYSAPSGKCISPKFRSMQGKEYTLGPYSSPNSYRCVQTKSGITYCLSHYSGTTPISSITETATISSVWIDTNGVEPPNMKGRDVFRLYVRKDGSIDDYTISKGDYAGREANFNSWCARDSSDPDGCIGKLINDDWVMNY